MKLLAFALACALAASARAEEPARPRHVAYVELLGKGGLGGIGYDVELLERLGAGAAASYWVFDDERILSISPYLTSWILGDRTHRWFVHAGPHLARVTIRSPVPEWPGTTRSGVGLQVASGWEYRAPVAGVVVRAYGMMTAGKGGVGPWVGVSFGWAR